MDEQKVVTLGVRVEPRPYKPISMEDAAKVRGIVEKVRQGEPATEPSRGAPSAAAPRR